MLRMPCCGAAVRPPQAAAGSPCRTSKAVHRSCVMHDEIGTRNISTPLRRASRPAQHSPAPTADGQSELLLPAMPRRAVLLAVGTGVLSATPSMPADAADAAKRRNLPVAELLNIIEQDFVEVRSEGTEHGA